MPDDDSDGSLAGRIRKTRRQVLTGLGGLGAAGVAAGKLSDEDDDPAIQSGGLAAKLGEQYYRDAYISSDPSTFDPSVMQAGEQYWLSDGEIGVYDGSQTQQYPLGTSSKPVPDIQASNMGVGSVNAEEQSTTGDVIRVYSPSGDYVADYKLSDYSDVGALLNQAQSDQQASSQYGETGGEIYLGQTEYPVSTKIDGRDGARISGTSIRSSVLKAADSYTGEAILHLHPSSRQHFGAVEWLKIDGNKANTSTKGIVTDTDEGADPDDWEFDHIIVSDTDEEGVRMDHGWGYHVENFLVERCGPNATEAAASFGAGTDAFNQCYVGPAFIAYNQANPGIEHVQGNRCRFGPIVIFQNDNNGGSASTSDNYWGPLHVWGNGQASADTYKGFTIASNATDVVLEGGSFNGQNQERIGLQINGNANIAKGFSFINHTFLNFEINGNNNIVAFSQCDNSYRIDGNDNIVANVSGGSLIDNGDRNIVDGKSYTSAASPGSGSSVWDGYETKAHERNVLVEDRSATAPYPMYRADSNGNWVQVA